MDTDMEVDVILEVEEEVDLNVALGLEDPPPKFNFRDYESKGKDSDLVLEQDSVHVLNCVDNSTPSCPPRTDPIKNEDDEGDDRSGNEDDDDVILLGDDGVIKNESVKAETKDPCEKDKDPCEKDKDPNEKDEACGDEGKDRDKDTDPNEKEEIKKEEAWDQGRDEENEFDASDPNFAAATCEELEKRLNICSEFGDLEIVYLLYCEYARFKGFSVRKGKQRYFGRSTNIRWKEFICSCTGLPNYRSAKHRLAVYKKLVIRSDCKARLIVSRDDMGSFYVVLFEKDHNHELVSYDQSYLLRSSRNLSYAKKSVLAALNSAGVGVTKPFNFMVKESGGVNNVGFTRQDAYHHIDRTRMETKVEDGDAKLLFQYFTNKANADPFFFWKYQLDDDGRLMNIFFRDSRCAVDYDAFGDVLSVDTTYRTNKYNMICAPFVGINHHTSNVMFGLALMSDETTISFKWLFETFLESMHGKQPKVIYTDQCRAMMNAIDVIFPNSKHRLCQWHISKNCASNFGKLNGNAEFKRLWYKCMNIVETVGEFDSIWKEMMQNYKIENRSWYDGMFNLRERWASVFSRGIFTAGLLATSRSESTNRALTDVVRSTVCLSIFVVQYEEILATWRSKERVEDTFAIWNPGQVIPNSGLLLKAARVFTRTIYKQFEYELANCITVVVDSNPVDLSNNNYVYTARSRDLFSYERKVVFNALTHHATCDCGKWETEGLICNHILKVFVIENVNDLPDSMIFGRWTKRAKDPTRLEQEIVGEDSEVMRHMTFANKSMRHMYGMVSSAMQHKPLRMKLVERMKDLNQEFSILLSTFVSPESVERGKERVSQIVVSIFRNPRKVAPRGFAVVMNSTPFAAKAKGRKRAPTSNPGRTSKRKAKPSSPSPKPKASRTINFMSTNEDREENENRDDKTFEDYDTFWHLSL